MNKKKKWIYQFQIATLKAAKGKSVVLPLSQAGNQPTVPPGAEDVDVD